jgi:hypothetical protein
MSTANDLITSALRRITSYQPGDQLAAVDANDCLATLNDLLDSWSTQSYCVFGSVENILYYTGGVYQYTIGTPPGAVTMSCSLVTGSQIVGATIPPDLIIGSQLAGLFIPVGAVVTAIGVGNFTMSIAPTVTAQAQLVTYTVPGAFAVPRPLRVTNAFTRINTQGTGYDYPIEIIDRDQYVAYGLKSIPYPWPTALWYNPQSPLGILNFYGAPTGGGELHLFTDTILSNVTLTQTLNMPQGYNRAIKWNLAKEICLEYGFPLSPGLEKLARESLDAIRSLNSDPTPESSLGTPRFSGGHTDAGGVLYGWYR